MLFNSIDFAVFLPIVLTIFWILNRYAGLVTRNFFLLIASYIFYGWWDYRFLSLIVLSTLVDYFVGRYMGKVIDAKLRKRLLWLSVSFNLGLLGFFKYYNFFVDSFVDSFSLFGIQLGQVWTLEILLPVGISFYTFQTMSYTLDIYRKQLEPTNDFISFAAYVAFFPQLVAGPIERASHLLPQLMKKGKFTYGQASDGLKLILWGLFKKMVIADSLAPIVDDIFSNYSEYSAPTLIMGAIFFGFQIYGDFSGYSDIAIGTSKLFGVELMSNFKFPYFSRNIGEFWRRWHISLSLWFRDYLYIPLGGSKNGKTQALRNIFIIFLVSGLWHGANWTFVFWGLFNAILFVPSFLMGSNRKYADKGTAAFGTPIKDYLQMLLTFILVTFGWIFFRSSSLQEAFKYIGGILAKWNYEPYFHPQGYRLIDYFLIIGIFVCYEFLISDNERKPFNFKSRIVRFTIYTLVVFGILLFYDDGVDRSFIYFQF
ncbi:MBOAT family protein [Flagellimonas lutimaris]|uniref:MBOAT family protein n=1 Tax=Flagellimonas lutimaris TaxID=475082 RepID=A0A3A1N3M7_9FLAO|nr:MBOAT family O-acyltransferase [Allomuricauda lutimaris]RIV30521.1 MBOAT family protein [Allomuricauda lutimaris]